MSEFLSLYVVDLPRFETFAGQALEDLIWYYIEHGVEESLYLPYTAGSNPDIFSYSVMPGVGVGILVRDTKLAQPKPIVIRERAANDDSFLSLTARDYLATQDTATFKGFLSAFSLCPTIEFVKAISVEERGWWLTSFLDYLETSLANNRDVRLRVVDLLQKILRGSDFGRQVVGKKYDLTDFKFAVIPATEDDLRMGVWLEDDVVFFTDYLHSLVGIDYPRFKTPPEFAYFATSLTDSDWNEWVYDMIAQFLEIEKYNFTRPNLVSFISVEQSQNAA